VSFEKRSALRDVIFATGSVLAGPLLERRMAGGESCGASVCVGDSEDEAATFGNRVLGRNEN
jgi:hypothetical protein